MLNKEVVYVNKWLRLGCACVGSIFLMIALAACKQEETLTKVKVAEVTHSIFYAPLYVAESKGFFKEEGLDVDVNTTWGGRQNDDIASFKRLRHRTCRVRNIYLCRSARG